MPPLRSAPSRHGPVTRRLTAPESAPPSDSAASAIERYRSAGGSGIGSGNSLVRPCCDEQRVLRRQGSDSRKGNVGREGLPEQRPRVEDGRIRIRETVRRLQDRRAATSRSEVPRAWWRTREAGSRCDLDRSRSSPVASPCTISQNCPSRLVENRRVSFRSRKASTTADGRLLPEQECRRAASCTSVPAFTAEHGNTVVAVEPVAGPRSKTAAGSVGAERINELERNSKSHTASAALPVASPLRLRRGRSRQRAAALAEPGGRSSCDATP